MEEAGGVTVKAEVNERRHLASFLSQIRPAQHLEREGRVNKCCVQLKRGWGWKRWSGDKVANEFGIKGEGLLGCTVP
jgi:hypothetical protein